MRSPPLQSLIIALVFFCSHVVANTESIMFQVPDGFSEDKEAWRKSGLPILSLTGSNRAIDKFDVPVDSRYEVEIQGIHAGDTYQAKICWTAANPINIHTMGYMVQKSSVSSREKDLRLIVHFEVSANSYPALKYSTVPINVSVAAVRMGIPVDLYATILYIALLMVAVYFVNSRYDLYTRLKTC
ncbi:LANO_0E11914g1_1 [Lachancea nothofagi CBS 11611]|uniref:LANO_0E11914g1_1 n=1 Tax=Lachancea nothofagi CBS 11611 TaxID=1266666 RepID=A0A1G4JXT9_9SACH|nr:LANO_0E11914g1_1 [Lachancea nothofagi CBS 11611]